MIRILIADDHQMFIDGLKALLEDHPQFNVVAEASNGADVLELLSTTPVDLILMDVNMKVMDGITATTMVRSSYPEIKILMLTMFSSRDYIEKVLKAGPNGYLLKNTGKEELTEAIDKVMNGESYFSREVTTTIMEGLQMKKSIEADPMLVELTEREKDVLRLIVQEYTSNEIADKLCISFHTVESHRKNMISKLQVKNIAGLVRYAMNTGIV